MHKRSNVIERKPAPATRLWCLPVQVDIARGIRSWPRHNTIHEHGNLVAALSGPSPLIASAAGIVTVAVTRGVCGVTVIALLSDGGPDTCATSENSVESRRFGFIGVGFNLRLKVTRHGFSCGITHTAALTAS